MSRKVVMMGMVLSCLLSFSSPSSAQTLVTPTVEVPSLSHYFIPPDPPFDLGYVRDRWDLSGHGTSFSANLTEYDKVELRMTAGEGKSFSVQLPDGVSEAWMSADIFYRVLAQGDVSNWADIASVELLGLEGGPAVQDYMFAYVGEQGNVIKSTCIFKIQGDVTFTGIKFTAIYNGGIPAPDVSKTYTLEDGGTQIVFSYSTESLTDPGVFVGIVSKTLDTLVTPVVEVPSLSHEFVSPDPPFESGYVRDRWRLSGQGPSFTANVTDYDEVELRMTAGEGKSFSVELPDGVSEAWMSADIFYRVLAQGDVSNWADLDSVELLGLEAGPAVQDYMFAYVGEQGNVIKSTCIFKIQGDVTFTGIKFTAIYNGGIPAPDVSKTYTLEDGGTQIVFSYSTDSTSDPGVFARIEPVLALCTSRPEMDFNDDCKVDFADFAIFSQDWLLCNLNPPEACWQ